MKERLGIVLVTVILFVAGLVTGVWTQMVKPPPPPPFFPLEEFGGSPDKRREMMPPALSPEHIQRMHQKMEAMRPQMEEFHGKFMEIQKRHREKMRSVLNEEQRRKFDLLEKKKDQFDEYMSEHAPWQPKHPREMLKGHFEMMSAIIYKPLLLGLTQQLTLSDQQQKNIETVLRQRRQEVLELIDAMPPPSLGV